LDFIEKATWINNKFKLDSRVGQDWHIENSDSNKLPEFIAFYLKTDEEQEIRMMFDLIIASLNDVEDLSLRKEYWSRIKTKVEKNLSLHLMELIYWTRATDFDEGEDSIFLNSMFLLDWIASVIQESTIKIRSTNKPDILINGHLISSLTPYNKVRPKDIEIIKYLKSQIDEFEDQGLSSENISDYYHIKKKRHPEFTFVRILSKENRAMLLKFRNIELDAELMKYV